jgi:hypothetical protein
MLNLSRARRGLVTVVLAVALSTGVCLAPACAAMPAPGPLFAGNSDEGFSVHRLMSSMNRRERVVQLCVGVMCLALFILCKKISEDRQ